MFRTPQSAAAGRPGRFARLLSRGDSRVRKRLSWIAMPLLWVGLALAAAVRSDVPAARLEALYAQPPSRFLEADGPRVHGHHALLLREGHRTATRERLRQSDDDGCGGACWTGAEPPLSLTQHPSWLFLIFS